MSSTSAAAQTVPGRRAERREGEGRQVDHPGDEERCRAGDEASGKPPKHRWKLSSEHMAAPPPVKTSVPELPASRVRVDAEVPSEEVERRVQQAARQLGR